jgi:hypothetical protein
MTIEELKAEKEAKIIEVLAAGAKRLASLYGRVHPQKKAFRRKYDQRPARLRELEKFAAGFHLMIESGMLRAQIEIILGGPIPRYALGTFDSGFINSTTTPNEQFENIYNKAVHREIPARVSVFPDGTISRS